MSDALPVYDWTTPARLQETDWDCSVESTEWALFAWGRTPDDNWIENSMIAAGVVDPAVGLCDASGAGLANWVNTEYGEDGYYAENVNPVSFDEVAAEAATLSHPIMAGGRAFYHWVGVRGFDAAGDVLLLANPAPGYMGVYQTLNRQQWDALGSFSMVRLTHPAAESGQGEEVPTPPLDYSMWEGRIGSGLLALMAEDQTFPAQSESTWLPLDSPSADVETCYGESGVLYVWLLTVSRGYRHRPA